MICRDFFHFQSNRKRDWLASGWPKPLRAPPSCPRNGQSSRDSWPKSLAWVSMAKTGPEAQTISIGYERRTYSNYSIIICCAASRKPRSVSPHHFPALFFLFLRGKNADGFIDPAVPSPPIPGSGNESVPKGALSILLAFPIGCSVQSDTYNFSSA